MISRAPLSLFALALAFFGLALLFVFFSPFPTGAQAPPTFTSAPTLTPIPTYTPPPTSPGGGGGGGGSGVSGYLQVQWLTVTIGNGCGDSWMFYPSSLFSVTVRPRDRVVISGTMTVCSPNRGELYRKLILRSSSTLSHTADVYFVVSLYGNSSEVKLNLEGTCPDGLGNNCRYYRNTVGSGVYRFTIPYTMTPRIPGHYYLDASCEYWPLNRSGTADCLIWVDFNFLCGGGCHNNPPNEPLCYCSGPGQCEITGDYVRVRSTGPISPLFNIHLPLGYDLYDVPEIPATYKVRGITPTSWLTLYADTSMRYNLYSFECVFPEQGFNTHEYSFYSSGGYHEVRADCASYIIPGLGIHPPYIYVQGIPLNYVTVLTCNFPFTPVLTNDLGPHDSKRSLWSFLPDYYEAQATPPPGYPTKYAWISYSGVLSEFSNAFDYSEYWLFSASLPPTRPFLPPVGGGDFITWTDGVSTCLAFPPLADQINSVAALLGRDPLPTYLLCIVPRLFRFTVPFADFLLDEIAALFVASAALYMWRTVRSRIS